MRYSITLIIIALIGLISSIMALRDYSSVKPMCEIGKTWNCKAVYHIPQAKVLGIHLSHAALIYFTILLFITLLYTFLGRPGILLVISILSIGGSILVPYLVYLEAKVAHAFCLYCTIMHAAIVSSAILSTYLYVSKLGGV